MRSGRKKHIRFCGKDLERNMLHAQSGTGERIKRGSAEIFSVCIRRTERIFVPSQEHLTNFFQGKTRRVLGQNHQENLSQEGKDFLWRDSIDGEKIRLHLATDEEKNFGCTFITERNFCAALLSIR